jgi:tRNA dimethylallyltransferase
MSGPKIAKSLSQAVFIAGPTAAGKSEIAIRLAEKLVGEIVSVDSMQVYRGLDIGTAKASLQERARVPHHLVDILDINQAFSAARFARLAREAGDQIHGRNHTPIFCGGTGLYFKALLHGLGNAPPADAALRAELKEKSIEELLRELSDRDPVTYNRIDRQNLRRVIRAIEVIRLTNKPFSEQRGIWQAPDSLTANHQPTVFVLVRAAADLRQRIDIRVEEMFERGLVRETEALLQQGLAGNETAMQALGYRQIAEYLSGARSLPQTIELVKIRTRQFAKRQMTWFRKQPNTIWLQLTLTDSSENVADRIISDYLPKLHRRITSATAH